MQKYSRSLMTVCALFGLVLVAGCATKAEVSQLRNDVSNLRNEIAKTQQMVSAANQSASAAATQAQTEGIVSRPQHVSNTLFMIGSFCSGSCRLRFNWRSAVHNTSCMNRVMLC